MARAPLVAFTDADRQFDLADLESLLELIDEHEVVCGYRVDRKDSATRRFYSWGYNALVRTLLGIPVRDCDCALKLFRSAVLTGLTIETDGFLVNAELLTRLRLEGCSVTEVAVRHRPRRQGRSKVSPFDAFPVLASLLRFWWTWLLFPERAAVERGVATRPDTQLNA